MNQSSLFPIAAVSAVALSIRILLPAQAGNLIGITQKKSGKTILVEVIKLAEEKLTFKVKNGKIHVVSTEILTADSLKEIKFHLEAKSTKNADAYSQINKAISHPLFQGVGSLWNQPVNEIAQRLKWPKESKTDQSSSFRFYPPLSYQFFGAHPYSAALYGGKDGNGTHISLVFANKGDFGSAAGFGENHFKKVHPDIKPPTSLKEAIEIDAKLIATSLTRCLGDPTKQYYGEKEDRRNVLRWDLDDHAILLSEITEEYTSLLIVSKKNADLAGKVAFVKDSNLKKLLVKNVLTKDNGDVLIKNIPMVDQGPKGYCAPATFERAMRYMLVPADMYLLATAATMVGGGTNVILLADSCKRIIRSKARRIKDLDLERKLKMRYVKTYINKGVPILWCMRSLDSYNKIANRRTKERVSISDFFKWKDEIAAEAATEGPSMKNNESNHHICMIIGYNEVTNELAVSDSWGARYELR